jgi:probable HAF family extracellular repeat protein
MTYLGFLPNEPFGGGFSDALGFNPAGRIVGSASADVWYRAVLWDKGTLRDLGTLPGGSFSVAFDINPAGQIVGSSETSIGEDHAVLWAKGTITDLGVLPKREGEVRAFESHAFGINAAGEVVGYSGWYPRAFRWAKGVMTELPTLGGRYSAASAINDRGQVVGESDLADSPREFIGGHAVLWTIR